MRARLPRAAGISLLFLAAHCGGEPIPAGAFPAGTNAENAFRAVLAADDLAQRALRAGRHREAAERYAATAAALADDRFAPLDGWRDQALYNAACMHARLGETERAAAFFSEALRDGLAPLRAFDGGAADAPWIEVGRISLASVLADPDLTPLHGSPAWGAALAPFLDAGSVRTELPPTPDGGVVLLLGTADGAEGADASGESVADVSAVRRSLPRGWGLVVADPPVALLGHASRGRDRTFVLPDGDAAPGVARVRAALAHAGLVTGSPQGRVVVLAPSRDAGEAVLLALFGGAPGELLLRPECVVAGGAPPAVLLADGARLAGPARGAARVLLRASGQGGGDEVARVLADAGVRVERVTPDAGSPDALGALLRRATE